MKPDDFIHERYLYMSDWGRPCWRDPPTIGLGSGGEAAIGSAPGRVTYGSPRFCQRHPIAILGKRRRLVFTCRGRGSKTTNGLIELWIRPKCSREDMRKQPPILYSLTN